MPDPIISTALAKDWIPALWKRWRKLRGDRRLNPARDLRAAVLSAVSEIQQSSIEKGTGALTPTKISLAIVTHAPKMAQLDFVDLLRAREALSIVPTGLAAVFIKTAGRLSEAAANIAWLVYDHKKLILFCFRNLDGISRGSRRGVMSQIVL